MSQTPNPSTTAIVWIALLVSQLIYVAIPGPGEASAPPAILTLALGGLAASEAVAVIAFFRLGVVARIRRGALDPTAMEGAGQLFALLVVCWAIAESIAIYGLVLRFLGASMTGTAAFVIGGLALMALTHPWQEGLRPPVSSSIRGQDPTPIT